MKRRTLIALAFAAGFTACLAHAGEGKGDAFTALDKNRDGYISKEEAKGTPYEKQFATVDKNKDGRISPDEHAAATDPEGKPSSAAGASAAPAKKK